MSTPTNSTIPAPVTQTVNGFQFISGPSEPMKATELLNLSAFLGAMQAALVSSSTYAAFQSAMAALPATP